jgi:hypothetical protein
MLAQMTARTAVRNAAMQTSATIVETVAVKRERLVRTSESVSKKRCAMVFAGTRESASIKTKTSVGFV